jgi:hypothetical protein
MLATKKDEGNHSAARTASAQQVSATPPKLRGLTRQSLRGCPHCSGANRQLPDLLMSNLSNRGSAFGVGEGRLSSTANAPVPLAIPLKTSEVVPLQRAANTSIPLRATPCGVTPGQSDQRSPVDHFKVWAAAVPIAAPKITSLK